MAFPESPKPNYSLRLTPKWKTLKNDLGESFEQRAGKQLYPQIDVTVVFNSLPDHDDVMILWDYYNARKGSLESFFIFDPRLHGAVYPDHAGYYIATADGVLGTFDIPGRSTSGHAIYIDGNLQTLTTDYTISTGTGADSADQVVFVSTPTAGGIITCDFTGILRIPVRFMEDKLTFEMFQRTIFRTGAIELFGLRFGT